MIATSYGYGAALVLGLTLAVPPAGEARAAGPEPQPSYAALGDEVLAETNLLRKDPRAYADKLRALRASYHGDLIMRGPDDPAIRTVEGVAALDEAIHALAKAPRRLPRLAAS